MPKRRKTRPNGVLTVLVIIGAAALLIVVGNLVKSAQQRRVPLGSGERAQVQAPSDDQGEINDDERQNLQRVLEKGAE